MKNLTILFFFLATLLSCTKEKTVNQFGEWTLKISRERIYNDSTIQTVSGDENTKIIFKEDYTGDYKSTIFRWYVVNGNRLMFYDCAEAYLNGYDFDIVINEKDHQVWEIIFDFSDFIQTEKWEMHEK